MYSVDCCPKGLVIGKQGENEAEKVAIDFSAWASEFGTGTISARFRRPKDSAAYPVVLTTDGTTATWTVSATDTQYAGAGSLQLVYIVGDVVAKSVIWPVRVLPSLEEGEAPEPYESWLDTLEGLAADTQENARDAAASAADASASATDAAQSAQNAAESAASITGLTAVAETLPEGSEASASFDSATDTLTLGIPKGDTGAAGPTGPTGPKGDTGADGFSPSVSVTKQDGNIVITVTDKDGTTSATLEVDDALDDTSENPVQNAAIVEAMRSMLPVDTASGSIASFPDGADDVPMLSLKAQIEPVQEGSGDPSPTNVRPISGHTGVNVQKRGKNLLDKSNGIFSLNNAIFGGTAQSVDGSLVLDAGTYTFSVSEVQNGLYVDDASGRITFKYNSQSVSFTITEKKAVKLITYKTVSDASIIESYDYQLELGSTATDYEAYQGETIPVSWESEAGTVYGGELDVVSGKLTVQAELETFDTISSDGSIASMLNYLGTSGGVSVIGDYTRVSFAVTISADQSKYNRISSSYTKKLCNMLPHSFAYNEESAHWYRNTVLYVFFPTSLVGDTVTSVKEYLISIKDTNPLSFWIPLAEPIEYTLTAQEVKTYLGQNNLWNDVGDTEVTYRADIQKFIEKKVTS